MAISKITTAPQPIEEIQKINEIIDGTASKDLDNLSVTGQAVLDAKADTTLSNVTTGSFENVVAQAQASGKETVTGWPFPSATYDSLALGASGADYTAPADGWYSLIKASSAASQYIDMSIPGKIGGRIFATATSQQLRINLPVSKGDTLRVTYTVGGATNHFNFVYANGEE